MNNHYLFTGLRCSALVSVPFKPTFLWLVDLPKQNIWTAGRVGLLCSQPQLCFTWDDNIQDINSQANHLENFDFALKKRNEAVVITKDLQTLCVCAAQSMLFNQCILNTWPFLTHLIDVSVSRIHYCIHSQMDWIISNSHCLEVPEDVSSGPLQTQVFEMTWFDFPRAAFKAVFILTLYYVLQDKHHRNKQGQFMESGSRSCTLTERFPTVRQKFGQINVFFYWNKLCSVSVESEIPKAKKHSLIPSNNAL